MKGAACKKRKKRGEAAEFLFFFFQAAFFYYPDFYPTNKGAMHNGSSIGICTVNTDFRHSAPNRTLSQHLFTIIINIVLCFLHLHVFFGIKSHTKLARINKPGHIFPFPSSVGNLLRLHC